MTREELIGYLARMTELLDTIDEARSELAKIRFKIRGALKEYSNE